MIWRKKFSESKFVNFPHCTLLQKLSKCEVKAALFRHFTISLPLRFWVKQNFVVIKNAIFTNLQALHFDFRKFDQFLESQIFPKFKFQWPKNGKKRQFLRFIFCQNWFHTKLSGYFWIFIIWALTSHFEKFWSIVHCVLLTSNV